jgi:Molybdopterin oxidoreductase/Voltage-dependent anion channel
MRQTSSAPGADRNAGGSGDAQRTELAPLLPGGEPVESLLRKAQFFTPGSPSEDYRELHRRGGRGADEFYRERWRHDREVRSTHGVNCTGSCSWKVYVKDGIIIWETQQTDYPSVGPDSPEYEPRGCPRGASFSWYTYSPSRVRYPYMREPLLEIWREARTRLGDPVLAWAEITKDPERTARYKGARGKGGFVRSDWDEVSELIAAAHVHTIKAYGPDRVVGFSPIPAMSMVSYSAGTRFLSMIGGTILSFYDWYAGATAISVLAGAKIMGLPGTLPVVKATAGFVEGFSYALWAFGTWWIPLLIVLGLWRHVWHHWPLTYEPTLWSVVFPLGMYSVATLSFGKAAHLAFMEPLSRFMLWVAVAAWAAVAAAFLVRLTCQFREPAPGPSAASATTTTTTT